MAPRIDEEVREAIRKEFAKKFNHVAPLTAARMKAFVFRRFPGSPIPSDAYFYKLVADIREKKMAANDNKRAKLCEKEYGMSRAEYDANKKEQGVKYLGTARVHKGFRCEWRFSPSATSSSTTATIGYGKTAKASSTAASGSGTVMKKVMPSAAAKRTLSKALPKTPSTADSGSGKASSTAATGTGEVIKVVPPPAAKRMLSKDTLPDTPAKKVKTTPSEGDA